MESLREEEHASLPYRVHTWKGKGRGNQPSGPSLYPSGGQGQDGNPSLSLHVEDLKPGAKQQKYCPEIFGKLQKGDWQQKGSSKSRQATQVGLGATVRCACFSCSLPEAPQYSILSIEH